MKLSRFIFLFSLLLLAGIESLHAATPWRTTHFEVFMGEPHKYDNAAYQGYLLVGADPDTPVDLCNESNRRTCDLAIETIESFLHDFAVALQDDGFADPTANFIQSIVDYKGREAVRVYLYDFHVAIPLGAFTGPCDESGRRSILLLNAGPMFGRGQVGARGFQNAAHELFHAVQFASKFKQGSDACEVGKWITEGTADAIGFDYARRLRNISTGEWDTMSGEGPPFGKPWGMRRYYDPLSKDFGRFTDDYQTSSFWRHLAELNYSKKNGQDHPGSGRTQFDYDYLVSLFAKPYGGQSILNDLRWLDSWMKSYTLMSSGLAPAYAQFVASVADHMTSRIPPITGLGSNERESRWLKFLFEECQKVNLDAEKPNQPVTVTMKPATARCVSVEVSGIGYMPVEFVIENSDLANARQKQLRIGAIGGQLVSIPDIRISQPPAPDAGTSYAMWTFLAVPGIENIFVISNTAKKAGETKDITAELQFSVPAWKSSLTTQSENPSAGQPKGQPKTSKEVINHRKSLVNYPTTNSALAAMAGADHRPVSSGCRRDMQTRNICGPQVSIILSKDFGKIPGQGPTAGIGGMLKQMGAANMQSEEERELEEASLMNQMRQMAQNNLGNTISISIPYVEYDYSGGFGNAQIEVSDVAGKYLTAVQAAPDADGLHPPNGTVMIDEYTPHILRGTFTAALVSSEDMKKATADNPVFPIAQNVRGSFVVSAPWRGSAKPETDPDSQLMTGMREDMTDFLLKMPVSMRSSMFTGEGLESLCQLGFEDEQLATLGISGSCSGSIATAGTISACDCRCEFYEQMRSRPHCPSECSATWEQLDCASTVAPPTGQWDAETERFQTELEQLQIEGSMFEIQMRAFERALPDKRDKMWDDLETVKKALATDEMQELLKIRAQSQATPQYDAETLSFKAAMEKAGKTEAEVNGLVRVFSGSNALVRKAFMDDIQNQLSKP